jgi:hypothetical protein
MDIPHERCMGVIECTVKRAFGFENANGGGRGGEEGRKGATHLRCGPHVRDEHCLGVEGLVVQAIAAVAVAAGANFVKEGAVHTVLQRAT